MKKKMKKAGSLVLASALMASVLAGCGTGTNADSGEGIYTDSVAMLTGVGLGTSNRYAGIVESENTLKVGKDSEQTVKDILVQKGDMVEPGTVLFTYDTEEISLKIEEGELKLEGIRNSIENYKTQIAELIKEKKSASSSEQLEYTTRIQEMQLSQKQAEYELKVQEVAQERLKKNMITSEVTCNIAGVVQEVNETPSYDYSTGEEKPFIVIRASGKYRVKGTISEQNISELMVGMPMVIRSRVDEDVVWYGTMDSLDTDQTAQSNGNMYVSSDDSSRASRYNFYVTLDSSDGLMLGQHVTIEPDNGSGDSDGTMRLMADYVVVSDSEKPYVWAVDDKNKLEKRTVEIGELDEEMYEYEILSGLEPSDYIAWPSEECKVGAAAVKNDSGSMAGGDMMSEDMVGGEEIMEEVEEKQ